MTDAPEHGKRTDPGDEQYGHDERVVAERLLRERPVPSAGFRGALGRLLAAWDPGYGPRPVHLRAMVAAYAAAGTVLLALGLLQASGSL
jgi:hypothetical protein